MLSLSKHGRGRVAIKVVLRRAQDERRGGRADEDERTSGPPPGYPATCSPNQASERSHESAAEASWWASPELKKEWPASA